MDAAYCLQEHTENLKVSTPWPEAVVKTHAPSFGDSASSYIYNAHAPSFGDSGFSYIYKTPSHLAFPVHNMSFGDSGSSFILKRPLVWRFRLFLYLKHPPHAPSFGDSGPSCIYTMSQKQ